MTRDKRKQKCECGWNRKEIDKKVALCRNKLVIERLWVRLPVGSLSIGYQWVTVCRVQTGKPFSYITNIKVNSAFYACAGNCDTIWLTVHCPLDNNSNRVSTISLQVLQCESENFTPLKFLKLYILKTKSFQVIFYTHISRSNLRHTTTFDWIILEFDEVMPYFARSFREFSSFTTHLTQNTNFWYLTTNKWHKCTNS